VSFVIDECHAGNRPRRKEPVRAHAITSSWTVNPGAGPRYRSRRARRLGRRRAPPRRRRSAEDRDVHDRHGRGDALPAHSPTAAAALAFVRPADAGAPALWVGLGAADVHDEPVVGPVDVGGVERRQLGAPERPGRSRRRGWRGPAARSGSSSRGWRPWSRWRGPVPRRSRRHRGCGGCHATAGAQSGPGWAGRPGMSVGLADRREPPGQQRGRALGRQVGQVQDQHLRVGGEWADASLVTPGGEQPAVGGVGPPGGGGEAGGHVATGIAGEAGERYATAAWSASTPAPAPGQVQLRPGHLCSGQAGATTR
jgi:hypothetical protein